MFPFFHRDANRAGDLDDVVEVEGFKVGLEAGFAFGFEMDRW